MGRTSKEIVVDQKVSLNNHPQSLGSLMFLKNQVGFGLYIVKRVLQRFLELKKDPGIPRLPDLKVRVRNIQKKPPVRPSFMNQDLTLQLDNRCHPKGG